MQQDEKRLNDRIRGLGKLLRRGEYPAPQMALRLHYTWRDHREHSIRLTQSIRFHLANGLVSLVGNLVLMRILVQEAHLPLLVSNGIAILRCSIINFCLGDNWVFALRTLTKDPTPSLGMTAVLWMASAPARLGRVTGTEEESRGREQLSFLRFVQRQNDNSSCEN